MLGLSFLLLMLAFRSIVVPAKAIVMNLLSVGAAYGLLVLVFQKGVGNELFGFQQVETIEAWVPLFLFSVLFGLSMDYHVFLLSRIREHYAQTGDTREAVAFGVGSTARIITGAALIMVAVFAGFAIGRPGRCSSRWASASPSRCCSTRRSSAASSCPRRWRCWATATGTCRAGSTGCRTSRSRPGSRPREEAAATLS